MSGRSTRARGAVLAAVVAAAVSWAASAAAAVPRSPSRFDRLGLDEGLSQSVVLCLLQDRRGFVWLGTQDGLNRFDGYEVRVLRHDRARADSLSGSHVRALLEATDGSLWVATTRGLDRFDPDSGAIARFAAAGDGNGLPAADVWAVADAGAGRLFVGTDAGLGRFDPATNRTTPIPAATGPLPRVVALHLAASGELWVGTRAGGLFRLAAGAATAVPVELGPGRGDASVHHLAGDGGDGLWLATGSGLLHLRPASGETTVLLPETAVAAVARDHDGDLWVGLADGGVVVLDAASHAEAARFTTDPGDRRSLSSDLVNALLVDSSGSVWLGTWGGGACRYSPYRDKFAHVAGGGGPRRLATAEVYAFLATADGRVLVGTSGGLEAYDPATGTVDHRPVAAEPLADGWIYALHQDRLGRVWAGTYDRGLAVWAPGRDRVTIHRHDPRDPTTIVSNTVNAIAAGAGDELWLATPAGLDRFDGAAFVHVTGRAGGAGLPAVGILAVIAAADGALWLGTDGSGLARLDPASGRATVVADAASGAGVILSLFEDDSGRVWAGSDGGGLVVVDPASGAVAVLTESEGLPNNVVYGICPGAAGELWVATNRGLARVDRPSLTVTPFDHHDGLQGNEFNQGAAYRAPDGTLYFGGVNGFNAFDPARLPLNRHVPPVVLTSLEISNRPVDLGPLLGPRPLLQLPAAAATVSFRFAALDFTDPQRNRYAYRLVGFDPSWVESGERRFVTYTNLDPGAYTFRVRAANADGTENLAGLALELLIEPPLWLRPWFLLLASVALASVVVAAHRLRVYSIERARRRLTREVAERTAELETAMGELVAANDKKNLLLGVATHELRQPLNLINGYVDIVLTRLDTERFKADEAARLLGKVAAACATMRALIEDLLDLAAIEAGKVELERRDERLDDVLRDCLDVHQGDAERKQIELELVLPELPPIPVDRARVVEIVDNLVSNAIKYTWPGGRVRVSCELSASHVVTHVADSGQGLGDDELDALFTEFTKLSARPTAGEKSTGLGLAIARKLVHLHGGEIWARSRRGEGSTFSFSLPLAPPAP